MKGLSFWRSQMEPIVFYSVFHKMSEHITAATTVIHDEKMAAKEIDRCLNGKISRNLLDTEIDMF